MNTENANATPIVEPVEVSKPAENNVAVAVEAVPIVTEADAAKPAEAVEAKPTQTNAVPQPQLGMPMFKRRADPGESQASPVIEERLAN